MLRMNADISYYAASANPAPEHPSLQGDVTADVCVIGGGIAPVISTALLRSYGSSIAVSSYAALALLVTCFVLFAAREKAREPLS